MNNKLLSTLELISKVLVAVFGVYLADVISQKFFSDSFIIYLALIFIFVFVGTILLSLLFVKIGQKED